MEHLNPSSPPTSIRVYFIQSSVQPCHCSRVSYCLTILWRICRPYTSRSFSTVHIVRAWFSIFAENSLSPIFSSSYMREAWSSWCILQKADTLCQWGPPSQLFFEVEHVSQHSGEREPRLTHYIRTSCILVYTRCGSWYVKEILILGGGQTS